MKSTNAYLISVTLPYGAQPGSARLFFGAAKDFPPALITYLQGNGFDPIGGIIAYANSGGSTDTQYVFFVEAVSFPGEFPASWVVGSFNSPLFQTQAIFDASTVFIGPFGEGISLGIGSGAGAASITVVPGSFVQFNDGSVLTLGQGGTGATVEAKSGTVITLDSGAAIDLSSGSQISVNAGGTLRAFGGSTVEIDSSLFMGGSSHIEASPGSTIFVDWDAELEFDVNGVTGSRKSGRGLLVRQATLGTFSSAVAYFPSCWQTASQTYRNGRAFECLIQAAWADSIAGSTALMSLCNGAGTSKVGAKRVQALPVVAGQIELQYRFIFRNSSGSDVSTGIEIGLTPSAGTMQVNGAGLAPICIEIYDIGDANDYLNYPTL